MPLGVLHAAPLYTVFRDPELYRYIPLDPPAAPGTLEARYARTSAGPESPHERWYNWAVSLRGQTATAFGTVELSLFDDGASAWLAYVFGRDYWGRGYASEACGAVVAFLREHTPVRSVSAFIDTRNDRSIALVERLGFARVETIENADHFKGSASNEYRYLLALRDDPT